MRNPNKLSRSEAGKLGQAASKESIKRLKQERINKYLENPKLCKECKTAFSYDKRQNNFCNQSCSASYNNRGKIRNGFANVKRRVAVKCKGCDSNTTNPTFCSLNCQCKYKWTKYKERIETSNFVKDPQKARKYLIEKFGNICVICTNTEWMGQPIPLTLDHINGNAEDNSLQNLRMICANCDRQTPTFGSKNRGNGRFWRRQRYAEGKSF